MIPNRFPDVGEEPEYNTADATLWFFEAVASACEATGDDHLLRELYPVLEEIVARKRVEVAKAKVTTPLETLQARVAALSRPRAKWSCPAIGCGGSWNSIGSTGH